MSLGRVSEKVPIAGGFSLDSPYGPALWMSAYQKKTEEKANKNLVVAYLSGMSSSDCMSIVCNDENRGQIENVFDWFAGLLCSMTLDELKDELRDCRYLVDEEHAKVPQISSFDAERLGILDILDSSEKPLAFEKLGYYLLNGVGGRSLEARRKYGENAARFAELLDLVRIERCSGNLLGIGRIVASMTWMGGAVHRMVDSKCDIVARLMFKSVLFRDLVCAGEQTHYQNFISAVNVLSPITKRRRASAFSWMLRLFLASGGTVDNGKRTEELLCHMRH